MSQAWAISIDDQTRLIKAAIHAKEASYSPYSKFRVGAAVLTTNGELIQGCNVENASYGGTICAERTALVKAVSDGKTSFIALAVTSDLKTVVPPCGICRQFIREFCTPQMPILLVPADYPQPPTEENAELGAGGVLETTLGELLPHSFGPEYLDMLAQDSA